jgi:DNA-binding MarR family transcriptional regulator
VIVKLARRLNSSATSEGLSPTQASILGLTVSRGPLGLPDLVEIESVHPTMLSRVVGKLTDAGLIRRLPDPNDLRSVTVQATRAGKTAYTRITAQRSAALAACVAQLSDEQAAKLEQALPALEALAAELRRASA